jgi:hypothetical protein
MNVFTNIWNHPRTSAAGLLIGVLSVSGVLSQQGITLGSAGKGTVISLIGAIASALLGLLARDPLPAAPTSATSTAKLGALLLCTLLIAGALPITGCSGTTVAQDIVNWTPALQTAVTTVDSTAALLAPADAPVFVAATAGFDAASNLLVAQARAYLANPSAGVLAQLQTQIVAFQQQVNASLLQAAHIVNQASQAHALAAINAVATVVNSIFALIQSISSRVAVAQMAAQSTIKLAQVQPYRDNRAAAALVANHYDEPLAVARIQIAATERSATQSGF